MTGRSSGILLPIFSLPGGCGVGSLGGGARTFVDFLAAAGQRWWQILPLVPPGSGTLNIISRKENAAQMPRKAMCSRSSVARTFLMQ